MVRERNHYGGKGDELSLNDVTFILEEIFLNRSVISLQSGVDKKLTLIRWNPELALCIGNCAVMTKKEAESHKQLSTVAQLEQEYEEAVKERMVKCLDKQKRWIITA